MRILLSEGASTSARQAITVLGLNGHDIEVCDHRKDLQAAIHELERNGAFAEPVLVQELERGYIEHTQAAFCKGALVAFHGYRQLSRGAGGGDATKISLLRPKVRPIWPVWESV
jgi:hypothetical protein